METNKAEQYKRYLKGSYNPTTESHYYRLFTKSSLKFNLFIQEGIDDFLNKYRNDMNFVNPLYVGFAKSVLDCFKLKEITIPKERRKGRKLQHEDYKFITKEEIDLLINRSDDRLSLIIRLFFETGLRLSEMFHLKIDDVDLKSRTFKGLGKGNKPFKVKFSLNSSKLLYQYMLNHEEDVLFDDGNQHPFRAFQYSIKKVGKKIGIKNMTPHKLRHSLGHYLRADKGFDLEQVRVKLRHADISTTQIYARAEQKEVDDKIDNEVFENEN